MEAHVCEGIHSHDGQTCMRKVKVKVTLFLYIYYTYSFQTNEGTKKNYWDLCPTNKRYSLGFKS